MTSVLISDSLHGCGFGRYGEVPRSFVRSDRFHVATPIRLECRLTGTLVAVFAAPQADEVRLGRQAGLVDPEPPVAGLVRLQLEDRVPAGGYGQPLPLGLVQLQGADR